MIRQFLFRQFVWICFHPAPGYAKHGDHSLNNDDPERLNILFAALFSYISQILFFVFLLFIYLFLQHVI